MESQGLRAMGGTPGSILATTIEIQNWNLLYFQFIEVPHPHCSRYQVAVSAGKIVSHGRYTLRKITAVIWWCTADIHEPVRYSHEKGIG
jgi:hypothetical protein